MEIFYKNKRLKEQPEILSQIQASGLELALSLYDKTYDIIKTGAIVQLDILVDNNRVTLYHFTTGNNAYMPTAVYSQSKHYIERVIGRDKKYTFESKKLTPADIKNVRNLTNDKTTELVNEIYKDFFVLKKEIAALDKYNENYEIKIVSNADMTIGEDLVVDELFLYKNNEKIGYLKAKYTTAKLKKLHNLNKDKHFLNKATIDYSKLEDEHMNKGLGYVMYFHMAQYLTKENIAFRMSTITSDSAKRLWRGIEENWRRSVINRKIRNPHAQEKFIVHKFLKIVEDNILVFENSRPKILKK